MIYDRKTKELKKEKKSKLLNLLYNNIFGRIMLKVLTKKWVSNLGAKYMNSKFSKREIKKFILKNNINMDEYIESDYLSFNDFFIRKIKKDERPLSSNQDFFLSPADAKLLVYKIDDNVSLKIKDSIYTVEELIQNRSLASRYKNGYCLVYRLCVDDYHRYSFIDDGKVINKKAIEGLFHTVQPIAFKKYKVFKENTREYTVLDTKNFGIITQIEVGATMVGKICNHSITDFKRGDEKGYFCFGGSTIVLLVEENKVIIDKDILEKSAENIETRVLLFEKIGRKLG